MTRNSNMRIAIFALYTIFGVTASSAQQKVGHVDSEYILSQTPEYITVQQQIDRTADEWNAELKKLSQELDQKFKDYQARELLYTNEERQRRRQEIMNAEEDLENRRTGYFGPEGEIFTQQEQLMRPIQERVLTAIEEVAIQEGFDYIFDKSGDFLFLFARDQWDISDKVLEELGIEVTGIRNQRQVIN